MHTHKQTHTHVQPFISDTQRDFCMTTKLENRLLRTFLIVRIDQHIRQRKWCHWNNCLSVFLKQYRFWDTKKQQHILARIFFVLFVFQNENCIKVMTGTVWDPAITGAPMRSHNQVLSFGKYPPKMWFVMTWLHWSDRGGYHRCDYNYTTHALVWWGWGRINMDATESGCLWA